MIYIDEPQKCNWGYCCHLISDQGSEELMEFAGKIGLRGSWLQKAGKYDEHFDLFNSYIDRATNAGARVIDRKELVKILKNKRTEYFVKTNNKQKGNGL